MPVIELRAGMKINIPNQEEIAHVVKGTWEAHEREAARTVKWIDTASPGADPVSGTARAAVLIPGPEEGWSWSAKIVGVTLAAAGTIAVYKASSTVSTLRPLGVFTTTAVNSVNVGTITWSSNAGFLQHGQGIYVQASQNITTWYLGAEEAMSEAAWRIFD